ncbi:MAG: hypothetical protein IJU81_08460 [Bacteroidales bacterium]|nr:hypothetical protein [Bacteroidales bacterium]
MKRKSIILIAVVVVLGVVAALLLHRYNRPSTFKQDYNVADTAAVTRVFMSDKQDNCVLLSRNSQKGGQWLVDNSYAASQPMIDLLLETLNSMRIREQVNRAAVPNVIKALSSRSTMVEVYQKRYAINWFGGRVRLFARERLAVTYFVGHETQDLMGSYVYREGDKVPYIIHIPGFRGFLGPRFVADPIVWRSHSIVNLNVRQIAEVRLEIPAEPAESFAIRSEGDGFAMYMLGSGQRVDGFDTARVAQLLASFVNLNFDEYAVAVPQVELDTTFARQPRTILTVTDTGGRSCELRTYIKYTNPNDLLAMPDPEMYDVFDLNRLYAIIDKTDTVLIQYYVFDNILQPASYFSRR